MPTPSNASSTKSPASARRSAASPPPSTPPASPSPPSAPPPSIASSRSTKSSPSQEHPIAIDAAILDAEVTFAEQPFAKPLILSTGEITVITEALAAVRVRVGDAEATGRGSIYLSDLWAWPGPGLSHETRDARLRELCEKIAADLPALCGSEPAHPLELGLRLHENLCHNPGDPPVLARAMCASPFDAAIHDATGIALGRSAFDLYDEPADLPTAEPFFDGPAWQTIRNTLRKPKTELRAWYVAGKNDDIETLRPWVQTRGYRCIKIKIHGADPAEDAARTAEVFTMARQLGAEDIELSVDTNEANPDAASVAEYYDRLAADCPAAFDALQYFEQPTGRDITKHAYDWHSIGRVKPVLLDEGLTDLPLMELARQQGWSGFALKTCKGQSFALAAAAWAHQHAMPVSLQDLTNPGLSMIHAALFASHVPTLNDVELNSPQFTPAANAGWIDTMPDLFNPREGLHHLPETPLAGLGSTCKPL